MEAEAAQQRRVEQQRLEQEEREARIRAEAAERVALASKQKVFQCKVEGQAAVSGAPRNLFTEGRLPVRATILIAVEGTSLLAGRAGPLSRGCSGLRDAEVCSVYNLSTFRVVPIGEHLILVHSPHF